MHRFATFCQSLAGSARVSKGSLGVCRSYGPCRCDRGLWGVLGWQKSTGDCRSLRGSKKECKGLRGVQWGRTAHSVTTMTTQRCVGKTLG